MSPYSTKERIVWCLINQFFVVQLSLTFQCLRCSDGQGQHYHQCVKLCQHITANKLLTAADRIDSRYKQIT